MCNIDFVPTHFVNAKFINVLRRGVEFPLYRQWQGQKVVILPGSTAYRRCNIQKEDETVWEDFDEDFLTLISS